MLAQFTALSESAALYTSEELLETSISPMNATASSHSLYVELNAECKLQSTLDLGGLNRLFVTAWKAAAAFKPKGTT